MIMQRFSYDDLVVAENWLKAHKQADSEPVEILSRALAHLRHLSKDNLSRADLAKYLRIQMGIDPKSEKLRDTLPTNQSPGSAIFRR